MEVRRSSYPESPLRDLSSDIVELQASWKHAVLDGRASVALADRFGREFAGNDRPDDDLYEAVGGITWQLATGWEANPCCLDLCDSSNVVALISRSIEVHLALRRDFQGGFQLV